MVRLRVEDVLRALDERRRPVEVLFSHGTLAIEMYKPQKVDLQKPHSRDEVYIISAGAGEFMCAGEHSRVGIGDLLFVPAGVDHRFVDFTDDFATWVLFYGREGGEAKVNDGSERAARF